MVVPKDREVNPPNNDWRPVGGFTELAGVIPLGTFVLLVPHFCLGSFPLACLRFFPACFLDGLTFAV